MSPETIKGNGYKLTWRGDEVVDEVAANVASALGEFGLRAEGRAKRKLRPSERDEKGHWVIGGGHGKRRGHLQRSIHTATPGHNWASDEGSAEMGGKLVKAASRGLQVVLQIGSGLVYALKQHQDHYDPEVHHYLTNAVEETKKDWPAILKKYKIKK
ncbi:MAG: hypothetical protein HN413_08010 [Chloroflexi bacterium]|jgi:hypothetical protein|nr:hypothetical protein [Chloroflexota bacterium]